MDYFLSIYQFHKEKRILNNIMIRLVIKPIYQAATSLFTIQGVCTYLKTQCL